MHFEIDLEIVLLTLGHSPRFNYMFYAIVNMIGLNLKLLCMYLVNNTEIFIQKGNHWMNIDI